MLKNSNKVKKIKKSQIYFFGSLLILFGVCIISYNYIIKLKMDLYDDMRFKFFEQQQNENSTVNDASVVDNVNQITNSENSIDNPSNNNVTKSYDYIGYLEIPKISLKRGFLSKNSKYNNISYNVTISSQSDFPDKKSGNLILYAHSGNAYIAYFNYLYMLNMGDVAYVTYKDKKYKYKLVKVEVQPKTGEIVIHRNFDVTTLTLITCTNNDETTQSIYIFELV